MSARPSPEQVAFDVLVAEQLAAIEEGGAYDFVLGLDDLEWLDFVFGWLDTHRQAAALDVAHQATAVALLRYWSRSRRET